MNRVEDKKRSDTFETEPKEGCIDMIGGEEERRMINTKTFLDLSRL